MAVFEQKISNIVTLDDTLPLTCTIEGAQSSKDHTEYSIRVQRGHHAENNWTISKRYSDFVSLNDQLKITGIDLPLPPKKVFGNMEREFIAERQQGLQSYLNVLLGHRLLANSIHVKLFLDAANYEANLQETALQHISMFFRSESKWEIIEAVPDIGWRVRKKYFAVKDKHNPKSKLILSWSLFGPDKYLTDKDVNSLIGILPSFQHPHVWPVSFAVSNDTSALTIRPFAEKGTLRDMIHKAKPKTPYLKKYGKTKCAILNEVDIRLFGKQILSTLKLLHEKGFAYGHLHAANIIVESCNCQLLDLENWFLGVPSYYRAFFSQFKKINTLEAIDSYSFGHLLYEMVFGEELETATCDTFPPLLAPQIKSVLESILTTESCKNGMPTLAELLEHDLFRDVLLPQSDRPQLRIPSKLKKAVEESRTAMEARLKDEQKAIHQVRRVSKAQAFHMSDAEKKKRRRSKLKSQRSQQENGETEEPMSPTSPPPIAEEGHPLQNGAAAVPPPPAPPPIANAPPTPAVAPPPDPVSSPTEANGGGGGGGGGTRTALLGSIQGFNKGGLKKAATVDKAAPKI